MFHRRNRIQLLTRIYLSVKEYQRSILSSILASYQAFLQGIWQVFYDKVVLRFMKFTRISLKLNLVLLYSTIKIKIWIAGIVGLFIPSTVFRLGVSTFVFFIVKIVVRFMKSTRISLKLNHILLYSTIQIKIWITDIVHSIHQRLFGWWFRYLSSFIVKFPDGVSSTSRLLQAVLTEKIVCPSLSVEIRSSSPVGRLTQRSSEVPVTYIAEMWPAGRKYVGCYRDSTVPACRCYTVKMLIRAWRLSLWRNNHPLSVEVVSKFLMGRSCLHQVCLCP